MLNQAKLKIKYRTVSGAAVRCTAETLPMCKVFLGRPFRKLVLCVCVYCLFVCVHLCVGVGRWVHVCHSGRVEGRGHPFELVRLPFVLFARVAASQLLEILSLPLVFPQEGSGIPGAWLPCALLNPGSGDPNLGHQAQLLPPKSPPLYP